MLTIEGLKAGYHEITVLHGLDFHVGTGQIVAFLGANGAGKSTLLNTMSGLIKPTAGRIVLENRSIGGLPAEDIVNFGISLVPQGRRIFPGLTVRENLLVARTKATQTSPGGFDAILKKVYELFPRLEERSEQLGWSLSGGEQQMLSVSRALISRPRVMLLDEPSLGLAPLIYEALFDALVEIRRREGIALLVVEQNAEQAMRIADHVHILELGRIVASGSPAQIASDPAIERAYLGG